MGGRLLFIYIRCVMLACILQGPVICCIRVCVYQLDSKLGTLLEEGASSKAKAWCCSTIHDAHGRHGQQCHDAVFRVYRGKAMKIV
jgi:hypothetical protein